MDDDPSQISPTARCTGCVWYRSGLAPGALVQPGGAAMFRSLQPLAPLVGGVTLERRGEILRVVEART